VDRVVLDSNVHISAVLFGGVPEALMAMARARSFELIASPPILDEIAGVLRTKFRFTAAQAAEVIRETRSFARVINPGPRLDVIRDDESDNRILECAVAGEANYIGSGDRQHLLPLGSYQGIPILPPAILLQTLQGRIRPA
jgi:uncharacterized protein